MCEFETKLVAWIDGELEGDEARRMEQHLAACADCSARAAEFQDVSSAFAAYRPSLAGANRTPRPRVVAIGAAIAAGIVLWMLRTPASSIPLPKPQAPAVPAMAYQTAPLNPPVPVARHRATTASVQQPAWPTPTEPIIEVAIPADAMFAPGAVPSGFTFAADLSITSDGSAQALRVRPAILQ